MHLIFLFSFLCFSSDSVLTVLNLGEKKGKQGAVLVRKYMQPKHFIKLLLTSRVLYSGILTPPRQSHFRYLKKVHIRTPKFKNVYSIYSHIL